MSFQTSLQYFCSNCKNILRETDYEIVPSHIVEPCPFCGSMLSESLQKRNLMPRLENSVKFHPASSVPRLIIDIKKLDSIIPFLSLNQKIAVMGSCAQYLIERLVVRAQLPHRHGGLDSTVIVVDGGNSSDPYLCIDFARQYGLDVKQVLSKIISSRAFTVYQLENLVKYELPSIVSKYNAKLVVVSDLLALFTNDPYLDKDEAQQLLASIISSMSKLKNCLVVVSISKLTRHHSISQSFDMIIKLSDKDDIITVDLDGEDLLTIKNKEIEIIPRKR
jgi:Rad51